MQRGGTRGGEEGEGEGVVVVVVEESRAEQKKPVADGKRLHHINPTASRRQTVRETHARHHFHL